MTTSSQGSDKRQKWEHKPIVHVIRVERVTPLFYTFSRGWRPWRQKIERIEPHLVIVSQDIPWHFPETFSEFCDVSYRSYRWRIMEVGFQFPGKFKESKDDLTGQVYRFAEEFSFKPCGYGLREENGSDANWFWAESLSNIVRRLKERAGRVESTVAVPDLHLPEELVERGMTAWKRQPIELGRTRLRPGDFVAFRPLAAFGEMIDSFDRPLDLQRIVTTRRHVADLNAIYEPPTAFPQEVLSRVQMLCLAIEFGEVRVWGAFTTDGWPRQESVLYYSNDGIRWYRRLSAVLQQEIDRLVQTGAGKLPTIS